MHFGGAQRYFDENVRLLGTPNPIADPDHARLWNLNNGLSALAAGLNQLENQLLRIDQRLERLERPRRPSRVGD